MKLIIFDFEVFKHDTLLGMIFIENNKTLTKQTWDLEEIRRIYLDNLDSIWIGHNNARYDNLILQEIVAGKNSEEIKEYSDNIIRSDFKPWLNMHLNYFDVITVVPTKLKVTEALDGKNISESNVDFSLNRDLTYEEKLEVESYNRDDLNQTLSNFMKTKGSFTLRLQIIKEFGLSMKALNMTEAQVAAEVLHAKKTKGIENWVLEPYEYPQLQIKNQEIKDFFLKGEFLKGRQKTVTICGVKHKLGLGGIHGARSCEHCDKALYFDVSGYYNLTMINYDLLPRSIQIGYEHLYPQMYQQQLEFKITAPERRWPYKTILLAVFGAMFNKHCAFYDPYKASLVTMTGQLFIVDLLEKLEGKVRLIQSNTDGIIAKPLPGITNNDILAIIDEWQERTGYVLHIDEITDIHQRDVNCYMYKKKGQVCCLGEHKHYQGLTNPYGVQTYSAKESVITSIATVRFFMDGILPEQTIEEYKDELRAFQFITKTGTYNYSIFELYHKDGTVESKQVQNVNRVFASKDESVGHLYKVKTLNNKLKKDSVANLPDNIFVYDGEILSEKVVKELSQKIDYNYYVDRSYKKIAEFLPRLEDIKL